MLRASVSTLFANFVSTSEVHARRPPSVEMKSVIRWFGKSSRLKWPRVRSLGREPRGTCSIRPSSTGPRRRQGREQRRPLRLGPRASSRPVTEDRIATASVSNDVAACLLRPPTPRFFTSSRNEDVSIPPHCCSASRHCPCLTLWFSHPSGELPLYQTRSRPLL